MPNLEQKLAIIKRRYSKQEIEKIFLARSHDRLFLEIGKLADSSLQSGPPVKFDFQKKEQEKQLIRLGYELLVTSKN